MVKVKDNCDRSGKHGFSLTGVFDVNDAQHQDFVHNSTHGQKAICFLGAPAKRRGTDSFDWFTITMPENVAAVDGMEGDMDDGERESRTSLERKKSRAGSSRGPPDSIVIDNDNVDVLGETAVNRLAAALRGGDRDSPEKGNYYKANTTQIELKTGEDEETRNVRGFWPV